MRSIVEIAAAEVGVREVGGNNCGPRIRSYQAATSLDPGPWPWCAAFVDWVVLNWVMQPDNEWHGGFPLPTTPAAFGLLTWAGNAGLKVYKPSEASPKPGHLVVYDFSHCGIVTAPGETYVHTIEGNTNGRGERDSDSGDGVWGKVRSLSVVRRFIALPGQ